MSIIADAVNNLTDAGSSILVMVGYIISAKPADHEHPYGHARMEYICGLFISVIVTVLGIELLRSSAESIFEGGSGAEYSIFSIVIMLTSVAAKALLALFYRRTAKKINSETLYASAADSIGDICATSAVILGIILTPYLGKATDGIFGAAVAIYILVMGIKLIKEASDTLLGKAPDITLVKQIVDKLNSYDGVVGIHDLVIHSYGVNNYYVTVHVEVDADRNVMESHDMIDNIEVDFKEQMGIQLVVHMDPVSLHDDRVNALHLKLCEILRAISSLIATRVSFTFTIRLPASVFTIVTVPPTTNPRFSRCCFTSGEPPIFLIIFCSPAFASARGIILLFPFSAVGMIQKIFEDFRKRFELLQNTS